MMIKTIEKCLHILQKTLTSNFEVDCVSILGEASHGVHSDFKQWYIEYIESIDAKNMAFLGI